MFKREITGLLFGTACLLAVAAPARAETYTIHGQACVSQDGSPVLQDPRGIHSVPPYPAWVMCLDTRQIRNYKSVDVFLEDRNPYESVQCQIYGQDADGNKTFGPYFGASGSEYTGPFTVFAGLIPNNTTSILVVSCFLSSTDDLGSTLRSVRVKTR